MELDIYNERILSNPDADSIENALYSLQDEEFAILRKSDSKFIQTLVDSHDGLVLEYRDGSADAHFTTAAPPATMDEVISAFISYADGREDWKTQFQWVPVKVMQANFTVVVSTAPEGIGDVEDPFDCEERVELPNIGIDNLVALYGLMQNATIEELEIEFPLIGYTDAEGLDGVAWIAVPRAFTTALASLTPDAYESLCDELRQTDNFPSEEYDDSTTMNAIACLSQLAIEAMESGSVLVLCALQ